MAWTKQLRGDVDSLLRLWTNLGVIPWIRHIALQDTVLSSQLPSLGALSELRVLTLASARHAITGTMPWRALTQLHSLDLRGHGGGSLGETWPSFDPSLPWWQLTSCTYLVDPHANLSRFALQLATQLRERSMPTWRSLPVTF